MKRITSLLIILLISVAIDADAKKKGRKFYLTQDNFRASEALTACADGYHMASLWEIFDVTSLRYDTTLGYTRDDSGFGPPGFEGRIRTGSVKLPSGVVGLANCNAWTSDSNTDTGSAVGLEDRWDLPSTAISPWEAFNVPCDFLFPVWCVQD